MGIDKMRSAGEQFEIDVARRMNELGWSTSVTAGPNDFGADIICTNDATKLVIQCKSYNRYFLLP